MRLESLSILAVNDGATTSWHRIGGPVETLDQFALGKLFDAGGRLAVAELTNPDMIHGPTIAGGELVERVRMPVVVDSAARPTAALTGLALDAWGHGQSSAHPALADDLVGGRLADELSEHAGGSRIVAPTIVGIGATVTDRWRINDDEFTVSYELAPGGHQGFVHCEATDVETIDAMVDGSGHLVTVTAVSTCSYCGFSACRRCDRTIHECALCGIGVCEWCATTDGRGRRRCRACNELRLLNRKAAAKEDITVRRRGVALVGQDAVHRLVFVRAGRRWSGHEWFIDGQFNTGNIEPGSTTQKLLDESAESLGA